MAGTYEPIPDYQIIIDGLPNLRRGKLSRIGLTEADREDVSTCSEAIIRYQGVLENRIKKNTNNLRNPVIWFREGVQQILLIPVWLLNWFGLIGKDKVADIHNNIIFQMLSGLFALIAFMSEIVTIVVGWDQFVKIVSGVRGLIFR